MTIQVPAATNIAVVFAANVDAAISAAVGLPRVAIVPDPDTWNDYGLRFLAKAFVIDGDEPLEINIRVMFEGQDESEAFLRRTFHELGIVIAVDQVPTAFCSLIPRLQDYKALVDRLGFEHAITALRKLGDAAVVRAEGTDTVRLRLIESSNFHLGALRSAQAFTAFRRGARFLSPATVSEVDDAAQSFVSGARLPNATTPYVVRFDFGRDELFLDRATVLIGKNGVGKTQLLQSMIAGLTSAEYRRAGSAVAKFRPRPSSRVIVFSSVASDLYPRALPPWAGIDYTYFSMISQREDGPDELLVAFVDCMRRDLDTPLVSEWFGSDLPPHKRDRFAFLELVLRPLNIWHSIWLPIRQMEGVNRLNEAIKRDDGLYFPLSAPLNERRQIAFAHQIDWGRRPLFHGRDRKPRSLSSGEVAMLRFAAQAISTIEKGSLLLFDEPETHLHPSFVSDFMYILQNLLEATKSAAIVATHSSYIVREVPRQRVQILSVDEGVTSVAAPRLQTFGASIDSISQFVFGDSDRAHRYQEWLVRWVQKHGEGRTIDAVVEELGGRLNPESLSFIAHLLSGKNEPEDDAAE